MSLLDRALRLIPSGAQTYSKARSSWPAIAPSHIRRGRDAHVWDSDGNEYVDFTLALGAVTLGYQDPDVEMAVDEQQVEGPLFSLSHPIESDVAEGLTQIIPCARDGMVKFFKTGSEATSATVRVARAHTGRVTIISDGYHGWADWACPNVVGIPPAVLADTAMFNGWALPSEPAAAVIIEPDRCSVVQLRSLRGWCDGTKTPLIFDEILTGFRLHPGGFQSLCGVTPDLATFSKALGNGYAIAAVVGKREFMDTFERVGVSGTFGGDTIGLAAAKAVINKTEIRNRDFSYPYYDRLWAFGIRLRRAFLDAAREFGIEADADGLPPRWVARFGGDVDVDPIIRDGPARLPWRTLWAQEMISRGVLGNFGMTACFAHSESDIERAEEAIRDSLRVVASVKDPHERLIGPAAGSGMRAA